LFLQKNLPKINEQMNINPDFLKYHAKFGADWNDKFIDSLKNPIKKSIRVNTLKISPKELFEEFKCKYEKIKWCRNGYYVDLNRPGNTIEHAMGYIYVQEASSMIPPEALDVCNGMTVLDLCAAPGSKTTQICELNVNGTVVANEFDTRRIKALVSNINRMGATNCIVTNYDGCSFPQKKFDRVLVDAPCSEVGTARKNNEILKIWNINYVKRISNLQKKLILSGFNCLKKGGVMVYSTCTTPTEENEEVVKHLLERNPDARIMKIDLNLNSEKTAYGLRIYPWHNNTECAFISKIEKI